MACSLILLLSVRLEVEAGLGCAEHQAPGTVPQPADKPSSASHDLVELREERLTNATLAGEDF
jgi:hypothetical protein